MSYLARLKKLETNNFSESMGGNELTEPTKVPSVSFDSSPPAQNKKIYFDESNAATTGTRDILRDFMEVDGLSQTEAEALVAVSVQPRPADEWIALIAELNQLIGRYCTVHRLSGDALARILSVRNRQSLATIPAAVAWFRAALRGQP